MKTLEEIKKLEEQGADAETVINELDIYIAANPQSDEALTMRGLKYWSLNKRSQAIKDYLAAIKINPESKSRMALKTAYEILNFYNKDLYNP